MKKPRRKLSNRIKYLLLIALLVLGVFELAAIIHRVNQPESTKHLSGSNSTGQTLQNSPPAFNKNQFSVDQAGSLWAVVDKGRILPSTYVPEGLAAPKIPLRLGSASLEMHVRADTAVALEQMATEAISQGVHLMLASGYRSYNNQVATYNGFVRTDGVAKADTYSARPGHSEHQTGLAADLEPVSRKCELQDCFGDTPEGRWLADNCYKFGFIIRYQKGAQNLTGYQYEPWHVRYVGKDLAAQVQQSGKTLEQFFDLPIYTSYPNQSIQLN